MTKPRKKSKRAKAAPKAVSPQDETLEQKLARLEREHELLTRRHDTLRMEVEILQKAKAFFGEEDE